ncbi:MAG: ElyC/SanA/YdcF family protein [Saprospiraceae bacterium]
MIHAIAYFLLNPLYHFLFVALLAIIQRYRQHRYSRYFFYYAAAWFFLIAISPLPYWLTAKQEAKFPVFDQDEWAGAADDQLHILVLGAGHTFSPGLPPSSQLSENALGRIVEGVRLHGRYTRGKLICSGYSSSDRTSQAAMLAQTAVSLGVAPQDTLMLPKPDNTEAEARAYTARFGTKHPLILVTSAIHMPRAMYWFREIGCDPVAAPTGFLVKPDPGKKPFWFKPSTKKIEMTRRLLHEYAGMVHAYFNQ